MSTSVNGELISEAEVQIELERMRQAFEQSTVDPDGAAVAERLPCWAREAVIDRVLLRQAAWRDSEPIHPEDLARGVRDRLARATNHRAADDEAAVRRAAETDLRVARLCERLTRDIPQPTETEIAAFYQENLDAFAGRVTFRASHIVKHVRTPDDEAQARQAIGLADEELRCGVPFAEVAARYSDCPERGGDLGRFRAGEMVEEFESVLRHLAPGEISRIFRSPFGFHIACLHERGPAPASLEEVRAAIESVLRAQQKERILEAYVDELRDAATIVEVAGGTGHTV